MSTDKIVVQLVTKDSTPMFCPVTTDSGLARVFAGAVDKASKMWMFPAIAPFGSLVIQDLRTVFGDRLEFSPQALAQIALVEMDTHAAVLGRLPAGFEFVTPPFDHQKDTVVRALYEPRTGILFDCGLGKTKTAIDVIRAARVSGQAAKTLVVVPSHLPKNWEREFALHAPGEFKVLTLLDQNNKTLHVSQRRAVLTGTREENPPAGTWSAAEFPDVLYTPTTPVIPEIVALEREYLRCINAGEDTEKARKLLSKEAKVRGLPAPGKARKLQPCPDPARDYDVLIVPTSILDAEDTPVIMSSFPYDTIIFDEAHGFRSPTSARSKAAVVLSKKAYRRHIMTGTPTLGNPMHLYAQLAIIGEFLVGSAYSFRNTYTVIKMVKRGGKDIPQDVAYKRLNVLNELVNLTTIRKRAVDCLDLPDVRIIDFVVDLTEATKALYNQMAMDSALAAASDAENPVRAAHSADRISKLFQIMGGFVIDSGKNYQLCDGCPHLLECARDEVKPYTEMCKVETKDPPKTTVRTGGTEKLDACMGLVNSILEESDSKIIIWCVYREELQMLDEALKDAGVGFVRVDGSTKDRVKAEDSFNKDPACRVYLSQITTGVGVTLTSANYTIYYGVSFDLSDYEQSRKRNERISQERKVTVYHLTVPGSVTDYIYRSLREKQSISDSLTSKVQCSICENSEACQRDGIKPFGVGCIYSATGRKIKVLPRLLR